MSAYKGLRVVDFSQGVAGPMAAMLLGDFEAEVVKVEPPGGERGKDRPGYLAFNRNKQVLELDLANAQELAAAKALIAGADVAIFDHAPGRLESLGLGAPTLTRAHPGLVHAWMPPYGTTGPWSQLPAHHSLLAGLSGAAFRQGAWTDQPVHLILPILHYAQGVMGSAAIGAALFERARSGRGQGVVVSGLHGAAEAASIVRALAQPPFPRGEPPGANPRYRLYQCADGEWFFLGTLFTNFYLKVFQVLGLEDAFAAFEFDMLAARDLLEGMFLSRPRAEWLEALQANDVPCGPVGPREAWFAGQAVADAGMRLSLDYPRHGAVDMPAPPARLSATPASVRSLPEPISAAPAWPPRPAEAGADSSGPPLAGVKVLNLGVVIAGAFAGTLLANLGADVVKVEAPAADPFRSDGPQFMIYNRGARGLGIDLRKPEARALFLELARQADVVIDNYRHGVRERLGIDYAALKAVNPRIISCSITAYGDEGARAKLPGFDPLLQAEAGMQAAQGGEADPILYTIAVNDVATASVVTSAVVAALNARERTGEGQEIKTSLLAQSLLFQLDEMVTYQGRPPADVGGVDCPGVRALHRYYACADGWIGLACETDAEAQALGDVLGIDLGDRPLSAPRDGELAGRLATALAPRPRGPLLGALLAAGAPAAPVLERAETLQDRFLVENGFLELWDHPRNGPVLSARSYAGFERSQPAATRPTPDIGEHTVEILRDWGVSETRIAQLLASGAVFAGDGWGGIAAVT